MGYDDRFPNSQRLQQALLFARFSQHDNLYAHPLVPSFFYLYHACIEKRREQDFVPVVDVVARKVIHIDFPGAYPNVPASSQPPPLDKDSLDISQRLRIPPSLTPHDFLPDLIEEAARKEGKEWKQREAPKPLHVVQPEGVSFKIDGHVLEWQKWKMHVGTYSLH